MAEFDSHDSSGSLDSVGIGTTPGQSPATPVNFVKSLKHESSLSKIQSSELPRLRPECGQPDNARVYDCVVYLMICSTHNKIAVTQYDKGKVVWLPYMLLQDGMTWQQSANEGLIMLFGKKDAEQEVKKAQLPKTEISPLHFFRIQLPGERYFIRYTWFVNVEKTPEHQCCLNNESINWIPVNDIVKIENIWGPEIIEFTKMLIEAQLQIQEQIMEDVLKILNHPTYSKFLMNCKINSDILLAIYEEYIEHCYPSVYMCMDSFKTFLIRFGYSPDDHRFPWLFNAIGKTYIDFNEFLIGIICFEPTTENTESLRLKMLFRFYKMDNNQEFTLKEFVALMQDIYNDIDDTKRLKVIVDDLFKKIGDKDGHITFTQFEKAIQNQTLKGTEKLCRSPKPIIPQIYQMSKDKNENKIKKSQRIKSELSVKKTGIIDRGICDNCKSQKYHIGLHCVRFDTQGRCVIPERLYDIRIEETYTPLRYSAENVFGRSNICRNLLDIVRTSYLKNEPLMTSPEDQIHASKTIKILCDFVQHILLCEAKFMKINAPALVVGNLHGNIDAIMSLEKTMWQSVPILTKKLIFLGNYSGALYKSNVEVLCYLFALKISAPNMVFLLRGFNETSANSQDLLNECCQKYGTEDGNFIWHEFNKVFNRLPFSILIDESIICVHSGIPKTTLHMAKFARIPDLIQNVAKESPMAYELINNVPDDQDKSDSSSASSEKKTILNPEFNFNAFYNFMKANHLSYLIRGHDTPSEGYKISFDSRCITISSTLKSFSMVVLIDGTREEINLIKIEHQIKKKIDKNLRHYE